MYKVSAVFYFELQKFAFLDMRSESDYTLRKTTSHTFYSHLIGLYFSLATQNMTKVYTDFDRSQMSSRDEFNLCEILLSTVLYVKFFMPLQASKILVKHLLKHYTKTKQSIEKISTSRLERLKTLLKHRMFQGFLIESNTASVEANRHNKTLSLISYKWSLLSKPSFLYDTDDCFDFTNRDISSKVASSNGFASDYLIFKFQEYLLYEMTNQIVNHGGLVSIDKILNPKQDEKYEQTEVEQFQFDQLINIYQDNMNSFYKTKGKITGEVILDTQAALVQFLTIMNSWKLRKFNSKVQCDKIKNPCQSEFIECIKHVLRAYESMGNKPGNAVKHCVNAVISLERSTLATARKNDQLIENFELIIIDWTLSAQTHLWTNYKVKDINFFNVTLKRYRDMICQRPHLNCKVFFKN